MASNEKYTVLYGRLSQEDTQKTNKTDDSNSIQLSLIHICRECYSGTCSWPGLPGKACSRLGVNRFLLHVVCIAAGGIVVVHERLIPQALRHIQRFIAQLVGDLSSLVVLADGVGAGGDVYKRQDTLAPVSPQFNKSSAALRSRTLWIY